MPDICAKRIATAAPPVYTSGHVKEMRHLRHHHRRRAMGDAVWRWRAPIAHRTSVRQAAERRRFGRVVEVLPASTERLIEPRRAKAERGSSLGLLCGRLVVVWGRTPPNALPGGLVSSGQVERRMPSILCTPRHDSKRETP